MLVVSGAISAGTAVLLGAFGAHGLRDVLDDRMLAIFETGVRYQMYHALALLALGALKSRTQLPLYAVGALFLAGTLMFSGSLYALALTGVRALGMITPIGGVAFAAGWILLAWRAIRHLQHDNTT